TLPGAASVGWLAVEPEVIAADFDPRLAGHRSIRGGPPQPHPRLSGDRGVSVRGDRGVRLCGRSGVRLWPGVGRLVLGLGIERCATAVTLSFRYRCRRRKLRGLRRRFWPGAGL